MTMDSLLEVLLILPACLYEVSRYHTDGILKQAGEGKLYFIILRAALFLYILVVHHSPFKSFYNTILY